MSERELSNAVRRHRAFWRGLGWTALGLSPFVLLLGPFYYVFVTTYLHPANLSFTAVLALCAGLGVTCTAALLSVIIATKES